jgi:dTDP-4-dehydrorhamnose reductase
MRESARSSPVCLVLGSAGQLGTSLGQQIARRGWELHALPRLDIADRAAVARALDDCRPDRVFNAAAFTQVDLCEERPQEARRANAEGPAVLAEACKGRALLVHVSTDYVFDGTASEPIPEHAPTAPLCVYGETKWQGEQAVRASGGEHLIVRTQWLFGPGPCFVRTILALARRPEPLRVVSDQFGRPTSSDALARALLDAAHAEPPVRGTLHLACAGTASWYEFARAIVEQGAERGLNPPRAVEPVPTESMPRPARRPAYGVLALDKADALGIRLPHWRAALEAYLDQEASPRG